MVVPILGRSGPSGSAWRAQRADILHPASISNLGTHDDGKEAQGALCTIVQHVIASWKAAPRTTPGGQPHYSALAITTALMVRAVFRLALRQTEGLIGSILHLLGLELPVPDHSTIGRRARTVKLPTRPRPNGEPLQLLVDSTGLKLGGPGEWLLEKHGTKRRRAWRVLHLGMDVASGRIVAATLTDRGVDDAAQVGPLLDQMADPVVALTGDGTYDRSSVYADVHERHPKAEVIVPPRVDAAFSATAETAPTQRDRHLQVINARGRMAWQRDSGYNVRARVEGQIGRWKRVIGDSLRFHTDEAQAAEVAIAVKVLNRMLDLGRPNSVRVA